MKCTNCGAEISTGAKFCPACGTAVNDNSVNQSEGTVYKTDNTASTQNAGNNSGDILKVLKYFGIVISILFALFTIFNVFGLLFGLIGIFTNYYHVYAFFREVFSLIKLLGNAAIAIGFFTTCYAFSKKKVNAGFSLVVVGNIALLIYFFLSTLTYAITFKHFFPVGLLGLIFSLILAGVLFGLLYASGNMPYIGCTTDVIKADVMNVVNDVKDTFNQLSADIKKGQDARNTSAAQNVNNMSAQNNAAAPNNQITNQTIQMRGVPTGMNKLKTDRNLLLYILLNIVTCGIYGYFFIYSLASDVNTACQGDGKQTTGLALFIIFSILTCGIYAYYWYYALANRLAENAPRYGLNFSENGTTVLLWIIFGSMLCGIGPFIAMNILINNSNAICAAYNRANNLM